MPTRSAPNLDALTAVGDPWQGLPASSACNEYQTALGASRSQSTASDRTLPGTAVTHDCFLQGVASVEGHNAYIAELATDDPTFCPRLSGMEAAPELSSGPAEVWRGTVPADDDDPVSANESVDVYSMCVTGKALLVRTTPGTKVIELLDLLGDGSQQSKGDTNPDMVTSEEWQELYGDVDGGRGGGFKTQDGTIACQFAPAAESSIVTCTNYSEDWVAEDHGCEGASSIYWDTLQPASRACVVPVDPEQVPAVAELGFVTTAPTDLDGGEYGTPLSCEISATAVACSTIDGSGGFRVSGDEFTVY
ncbi:hypothetical protein GC722_05460 [Auraticoccus sp. F435]|uniref:Uncharacterized protein n=1 Tax=Auraticoccus cholistanensis TaxID=2656650 RepID=A0A6A9USA1_9ACTN|nr:hypothetical protein [Auraticoccus cholistanensis]MVA75478.1 hypothetical protein [Auraticoccus cholistanensis]